MDAWEELESLSNRILQHHIPVRNGSQLTEISPANTAVTLKNLSKTLRRGKISAIISKNFNAVELVGLREMMLNGDRRQIDLYEEIGVKTTISRMVHHLPYGILLMLRNPRVDPDTSKFCIEQAGLKSVAVIPARLGSTRFQVKPLALIYWRTMIEHVYARAKMCQALDDVIVATCDIAILNEVESFGGRAIMTSDTHERASDRVAEAVAALEGDIFVLVQGDDQ